MDFQKELLSLTGEAAAMVARVNRLDEWGQHFNLQFAATAGSSTFLKIGVNVMNFYEREFATISRQAAVISEQASEIRSCFADFLN